MSNPTPFSEAQAAAFAEDPRIHYAQESGTWRLEQDDGAELEYDPVKEIWVPLVDEELVRAQQAAYSVAGVDEAVPAAPVLTRENKKRKPVENYTAASEPSGSEPGPSTKRGKANPADPSVPRKSKNTAVFVSGLPVDSEADEIAQRFARFGVIEEDDSGEPKVKMYAKDDGTFGGECLVVYFKEESVPLAINMLDEAELRIGDPATVMRVSMADFGKGKSSSGTSGATGVVKERKVVDKKKATRRIGKMQAKLLEWDDEDGFGPQLDDAAPAAKPMNARVVVLKHMFTLKELIADAALLLDLKEDVREECSALGEVTNVVLYDKEPDGIMTVKFKDPISAQACLLKMNGRFFSGRRIEATSFSGKARFKRSGTSEEADGEGGEDDEKKRLDDFTEWLMNED